MNLADVRVQPATRQQWLELSKLAQAEGWNPGINDWEIFYDLDPDGCFAAEIDDTPVAGVSLIAHSETFAVWGSYIVAPPWRGLGLGRAVCRRAIKHAGARVLASDAMPHMVENYRRSGLQPVHDTVLSKSTGRSASSPQAEPLSPPLDKGIATLDARTQPSRREQFISAWLTAPRHVVRTRTDGDRVQGYGVLRPAADGWRIGPIVGANEQVETELMEELIDLAPASSSVWVLAPAPIGQPSHPVSSLGFTEIMRVRRMYTAPAQAPTRTAYAISSLEVG